MKETTTAKKTMSIKETVKKAQQFDDHNKLKREWSIDPATMKSYYA